MCQTQLVAPQQALCQTNQEWLEQKTRGTVDDVRKSIADIQFQPCRTDHLGSYSRHAIVRCFA